MTDPVATTISILALAVSSITAWLTFFRRGTVKMTKPSVIFLGPDTSSISETIPYPKVYMRMLIFSTSKRGRIIENLHVSLTRNETSQNFNIWVYGEDKLMRGSGLFVGETGVATNHHFLTPKDGSNFRFVEGIYKLEVHVKLLGNKSTTRLLSQSLEITRENAIDLQKTEAGLYFDWGPDFSCYISHVENRRPTPEPHEILKLIGMGARSDSAQR